MRRSIDDSTDDWPGDPEDHPGTNWAVALAADYEGGEMRVIVTFEEVGNPGAGLVAHLAPATARRMRVALRDALREMGEDPGG